MHVSNRISYFSIIFLFLALVLLCSPNVIISYEKTDHDTTEKSALMKTTDCINSLITGVFMGSNSGNCGNINNNDNNSDNLNSSRNGIPLDFKTQTGQTSDFLAMNHGLTNVGNTPSLDDPSTYARSLTQSGGIPIDNTSHLHPSIDDKSKDSSSSTSSDKNDEVGNLLNKKNKHGNEIFACFNRAIVSTDSLPDSAIIKCAKDYDSFK